VHAGRVRKGRRQQRMRPLQSRVPGDCEVVL
jgi:hypothetical protein